MPIETDAVNMFAQVSLNFESSILNITFIMEGEKFYSIKYGPVKIQDCKHLQSVVSNSSYTNSLSLRLNYMENTAVNFFLVVRNGTVSVTMKGIYYPDHTINGKCMIIYPYNNYYET